MSIFFLFFNLRKKLYLIYFLLFLALSLNDFFHTFFAEQSAKSFLQKGKSHEKDN